MDPPILLLKRPATGSTRAVRMKDRKKPSTAGVKEGKKDRWCSREEIGFCRSTWGGSQDKKSGRETCQRGGEREDFNTLLFNIQAGKDNQYFTTVVDAAGTRFVEEIATRRNLTYFDGHREATLSFKNGKLENTASTSLWISKKTAPSLPESSSISISGWQSSSVAWESFMNLFRGEMLDKTLHYWFLAPARREVLLAGKYGAGLIASTIIFAGAPCCVSC